MCMVCAMVHRELHAVWAAKVIYANIVPEPSKVRNTSSCALDNFDASSINASFRLLNSV